MGRCSSTAVIESATGNADLKVQIVKRIDAAVRPDAVIGSTTSSVNPAPVMGLVEVVRDLQTTDARLNSWSCQRAGPRPGQSEAPCGCTGQGRPSLACSLARHGRLAPGKSLRGCRTPVEPRRGGGCFFSASASPYRSGSRWGSHGIPERNHSLAPPRPSSYARCRPSGSR
jgi:hypothetical protein